MAARGPEHWIMYLKKYEKPDIMTIGTQQVLQSLGPAHAGYGDPMLGPGD